MMKKILVLLLSAMMVFSLVACGGDDTTGGDDQQIENNVDENNDDADVAGDYTEEQAACIEVYEQMLADYNAAIDLANTVPELTENTEFVDMMNEVSASIDTMTDMMADPANMTDEFMGQVDVVIENAYIIIERVELYAELLPVLTLAGAGADADENTYWFACDEDETVGAMVILSADMTQNLYCIGEMTVDENGVYTIVDEEGYTLSMVVEVTEDSLILTLDDGTEEGLEVVMLPEEPIEVVEMILSVLESTENVNQ